jgi:Holliday junction resolvase RusA-like endonuclease
MEEMLMVGEILYSADDKDMKYTANMRAMTTYFTSKNQKQYEGEIASMMKQHTIIR